MKNLNELAQEYAEILNELAQEYADKNFPILSSTYNYIKNTIAFHSFVDGFNEAIRILMQIGGQKGLANLITDCVKRVTNDEKLSDKIIEEVNKELLKLK